MGSMINWGTFDSKSLFKGGTLDSFTLSHFHTFTLSHFRTFTLSHFHTLPHFHTSTNRDKARIATKVHESSMINWGTFDSKSLFKGGKLDSFTLSHNTQHTTNDTTTHNKTQQNTTKHNKTQHTS